MSEQLNHKTMITLVNKRNQSYTVSLPSGEYYEWLPATSGVEDSQELTFRDVQYIHTRSSTFKQGFLYVDNADARKRLGLEKEEIKALTMSREEIEKLLKGNMTQFKKLETLQGNRNMVSEIIDVAKELKIDNTSKVNLLSKWSGIPSELIIVSEEEDD